MDWEAYKPGVLATVQARKAARLVLTGANYVGNEPGVVVRSWHKRVPDYWASLADIDIGLAPLTDHPFNLSKSFIKILEYSAAGIPWVASNVGPYYMPYLHGDAGFLADTPEEFSMYLNALIQDGAMRSRMGRAAREWAAEYTIERWAPAWAEVLAHG